MTMEEFDFIGPRDKPALLAVSEPEVIDFPRRPDRIQLERASGGKPQSQFDRRYSQVNYQVVIIEENFAGSVHRGQFEPANGARPEHERQKRYATFFLIGQSFESLNTLQAFAQSVHCVLNFAELPMLSEVLQKTVAERTTCF